jgi:hypothetical protein
MWPTMFRAAPAGDGELPLLGNSLYFVDFSTDKVYELVLSTEWDLSSASLSARELSVGGQEGAAYGLHISRSGTNLYICGGATTGRVHQYALSTPWNLSTGSFVRTLSVNTNSPIPRGIFFKPDGSKFYLTIEDLGGSDYVTEYALGTPWDISTASYSNRLTIAAAGQALHDLYIKPDGLKLYAVRDTGASPVISRYSMPSAWVVSSATSDSNEFGTSGQEGDPTSVWFSSDGGKMYVGGSVNNKIYQYSLSTAWDVSSASYDSVSFDATVAGGTVAPRAICMGGTTA